MRTHPSQSRKDFSSQVNNLNPPTLPTESNIMVSSNSDPAIESNTMSPSVYTNQLQSAGDQHEILVSNLYKDMGNEKDNLMHAAAGIAGEAGELLDAIKKHWAYNKPLDLANVVEELGDLEFYMRALRKQLNISREYVLINNIEKLSKRYSSGTYSDQQAQERADKTIAETVLPWGLSQDMIDLPEVDATLLEDFNKAEEAAILNGERL